MGSVKKPMKNTKTVNENILVLIKFFAVFVSNNFL